MRRAAGIACLIAFGCAKQQSFIQLPNTIEFVALISLSEDGAFAGATPLERYREDAPPEAAIDPQQTSFFVGWTAEQLGALAEQIADGDRLEAAPGCRTHLPVPEFYAKIDGERLSAADAATAPPLGAKWLDAACAPSALPTDAVLDCPGRTARMMFSENGPCVYRASTEGGEPVQVVMRPPGFEDVACVESMTPLACRGAVDYVTGLKLLCETKLDGAESDCSLLLYERPADPSYSEEEISLAEVSPFVPEPLATRGDLRRDVARPGYLYDLVPLANGSVLVTLDSVLDAAHDCTTEEQPPPAELRAYDADTLALRWSHAAPPCLGSLIADPISDGFLGVYRSAEYLALGRFTPEGAWVMSATIADDAEVKYVYQTLILEDRSEVMLVLSALPKRTIIAFDLATFRETARAPSALQINAVAQLDASHMVFPADPRASRCIWDMNNFAAIYCAESDCFPQQWNGFSHELFDYYRDVGRDAELVSVSTNAASVWACGRGETPTSIGFYERITQPGFVTPHPFDDGLLLISGISQDAQGALGGTIDTLDISRRRILPGTMSIAGMYTGRMRVDQEKRLWLLHPWNGTITRLVPR